MGRNSLFNSRLGYPLAFNAKACHQGAMTGEIPLAKFRIGQVVKHRLFPFRGVIFDVDPIFNNTEEWWLSIPEDIRPRKDQPFYHLFAENDDTEYVAYVSEQNLLDDETGEPVRHPQIREFFEGFDSKKSLYRLRGGRKH
jgi:heat shock protein HspQ